MKHFKRGEPCLQGKAGVIYWDLDLVFIAKEQRNLLVTWLLEQDIDYDFEVTTKGGDSFSPDKYIVSISDMSWGSNLASLSEYLKTIDYNAGGDDDN